MALRTAVLPEPPRGKVLSIAQRMVVSMSKNSQSNKMSVAGFQSVALGALAQRDVAILAAPTQVVGGTLVTEKSAHLISAVDAADGPFIVGVATAGLSATEIEEAIEIGGPSGPTHKPSTETSSRWRHIRVLGLISPSAESDTAAYRAYFDKVVKMGWTEGDTGWTYWIYNMGAALTTGSTWEITTMGSFVVYDKD